MKLLRIGTGICALCLIAFLLVAGCTSQTSGSEQTQNTAPAETPQVTTTPTAVATPGSVSSDNGAFIDDSGNVPSQDQSQVTLAPDIPVGTSSGAAAQNLTPDSTDFGDITP
jgi:hypothetical protein